MAGERALLTAHGWGPLEYCWRTRTGDERWSTAAENAPLVSTGAPLVARTVGERWSMAGEHVLLTAHGWGPLEHGWRARMVEHALLASAHG
jgi:hypothetical protein